MAESTIYIDGSFIANAGLELIDSHHNRDYNFLSKLADLIADSNYYVKRGESYYVVTSLSKKRIRKILDSARIPYASLDVEGHLKQRVASVTF